MNFKNIIAKAVKDGAVQMQSQIDAAAAAAKDTADRTAALRAMRRLDEEDVRKMGLKKGGSVKSSASKRADGCVKRGKTKGKMV